MNIIDTKINLSSERPQLKIGDKLYKVDNRKKTADKYDEIMNDPKILLKDKEPLAFELLLGKKEAKEILEMDLTVSEYKHLYYCLIAAMSGEDVETIKELFKNMEKNM